jgi:hypothetical protein
MCALVEAQTYVVAQSDLEAMMTPVATSLKVRIALLVLSAAATEHSLSQQFTVARDTTWALELTTTSMRGNRPECG